MHALHFFLTFTGLFTKNSRPPPPDPDRFYCNDLREQIQQKHPIYSACPPLSPQSAGYTNTSQDEGLLPSTEASQHA